MATIKRKSRNPHKLGKTVCAVKVGSRKRRNYPDTQAPISSANDRDLRIYLRSLPLAEPWLDSNPEAKAAVERGLEEAKQGKTKYLGSFSRYAV
jgi:hypothetical protein